MLLALQSHRAIQDTIVAGPDLHLQSSRMISSGHCLAENTGFSLAQFAKKTMARFLTQLFR